jgi:alpha-tubulin suppressor-like RCC1 family protein
LGSYWEAYKFKLVNTSTIDGKVIKVIVGAQYSFILTDSGKLYGTGYNRTGTLGLGNSVDQIIFKLVDTSTFDGNISEVIAGGEQSFIFTDSEKLYATGLNTRGELGLGDQATRFSFELVDASAIAGKIDTIATGDWYSLILTEDGAIYGTGSNAWGMLGLPEEDDGEKTSFIQVW